MRELEVKLQKTGISAFVRIKDRDAESTTFEIRFPEPILVSVLDALACDEFGSGYTVTEHKFTIRFVGLTHKEICPKLDSFLKRFDEKLARRFRNRK